MNLADLRLLLDYNYWARDRLLAAAAPLTAEQYTRDLGSSFKSIRDTVVHMYSAEWIWNMRLHGTSPAAALQAVDYPDVSKVQSAWMDVEAQTRSFLDEAGEPGIARTIDFKLINGQAGRAVLGQVVQHVVNHSSYHRGQVTTMLRQIGATPAKSLDLITFYRERAN